MSFPIPNPALLRALAGRGYQDPTPVQQAVLEPEASDRDLLVSAQTGSGKTVAFGLAIRPHHSGRERNPPRHASPAWSWSLPPRANWRCRSMPS